MHELAAATAAHGYRVWYVVHSMEAAHPSELLLPLLQLLECARTTTRHGRICGTRLTEPRLIRNYRSLFWGSAGVDWCLPQISVDIIHEVLHRLVDPACGDQLADLPQQREKRWERVRRKPRFTGSEIFANVAPRYGGASGLYLNFATAALTNCNVFDNEGGAAAGVKLHYGSARLSGCRVYRNRAPVGAGAFAMTGYFEITNSHFYDNRIVDNNPPRGLPCAHTSKKHSATLQITCRALARGGG